MVPNSIRRLLAPPVTLGARATRAGFWNVAELGFSQALRLAGNLVMTRILLPEAFGLMAMVTTLLVGLNLTTDLGVSRSVVQSPEGETPLFLRVCWVVQGIRGSVLTGLVLVAAVLVWLLAPKFAAPGTVYADPRLPGLIVLSSLSVLMKGLESPNQFLAKRHMHAGRTATINLTSQAASIAGMTLLGLLSPSVWALLAGSLIGSAVQLGLTHVAFPGPRMRLVWDQRIADELWEFGKWLMGSSALTFVAGYADRVILGGLIDTDNLGLYTIALLWVQAGGQVINKLTGSVAFSVFSHIKRERPSETPAIFRRFSNVIDRLCAAGFVATLIGGPALIHLLYSDHYALAASFMPILGVGILATRYQTLTMLILSEGHSREMLAVAALRAVAICTFLPLGFYALGIGGALLATAMSPLAAAPLLIYRNRHVLQGRVWNDTIWLVAIFVVAAGVYAIYAP